MAGQHIIVGVDGSEGGRRALEWAIRYAEPADASVEAVMAWQREINDAAMVGTTIAMSDPEEDRRRAERVLADQIEDVVTGTGSTRVITGSVILGTPAMVLTDSARHAYLLVLGSHGHGRLRHALLGSVTEECIRLARCPVLVVPVPHEETATP